jgi:hypothetical protein
MATLTTPVQGAIVLTAFALPILTYLYFTRAQQHATSLTSSTSSDAGPLPPPTEITALYIHPIKSCHGISVDSARLLPTGLDLGASLSLSNMTYQTNPTRQTANGCGFLTHPMNSSRSATPPK